MTLVGTEIRGIKIEKLFAEGAAKVLDFGLARPDRLAGQMLGQGLVPSPNHGATVPILRFWERGNRSGSAGSAKHRD